jgi:hypothetical protein
MASIAITHRACRAQIPIAPAARPPATSRGFLPWRLSDAGPSLGGRGTVRQQPASETLHNRRQASECANVFRFASDSRPSTEARSFATLIQQSAKLGSSITEALRVYSDDMRHKRLSRAEEKAYSLPAKLSVPMMVCIFPVLFVVILLSVFVRLYTGHY